MAYVDPDTIPDVVQKPTYVDPNSIPDVPQANYVNPNTVPDITPVATPTNTPPPMLNATPSNVQVTAQTGDNGNVLARFLNPVLPSTGPYNPNAPLQPSVWSDQVKPANFTSSADQSSIPGISAVVPNSHIAAALLDTLPEKLNYLQKQYPSSWFGTDNNGNIVFSSDKGNTWNSFESWSNPMGKIPSVAANVGTAALTSGGGVLGTLADPVIGPAGSYLGAAGGSMAADIGKRAIAKTLGYTDQGVLNPRSLENAAIGGALAQGAGNVMNQALASYLSTPVTENVFSPHVLSNLRNAVADLPETGPLSPSEQAIKNIYETAQNGGAKVLPPLQTPLAAMPLSKSGFGPLVNEAYNTVPTNGPLTAAEQAILATKGPLTKALPISKGITKVMAIPAGAVAGTIIGHGIEPGVIGTLGGLYEGGALGNSTFLSNLLPKAIAPVITSPIYNPGTYVASGLLGGNPATSIDTIREMQHQ